MPRTSLGPTGPPFSEIAGIPSSLKLPATITTKGDVINVTHDLKRFLSIELATPRLDRIHSHLHYAGAPRFARPLHRQLLLGRKIIVTEDVDEHLVWYQARLFVKPLHPWLLDWRFWLEHICPEQHLLKAGCGFLVSYTWLICRPSDFALAMEHRLVPEGLTWNQWTVFLNSFLEHINLDSLHQVTPRYQYGELRLTRLNRIYRWTTSGFSVRNFFRGYLSLTTWYQDLFRDSFGWLIVSFAYLTVVSSALQVGLATNYLHVQSMFQRASFVFSIASLTFVTAMATGLGLTWLTLTVYYYTSAKLYHRRIQKRRARAYTRHKEEEMGMKY